MTAFYNEIDPKAAAWLRELIADGLIAPGSVDERDVRDIAPDELRSFQQCHFFAGIGGWSAALRRAGWPDQRRVWTVSCPCQPFSAAGGRGGFADERHLWPAFFHLASQCRPDVVLGEQVASKDGLAWLDLVSADMEAAGYSGGALDLCSAGFGAPNIRQRLYFVWMADAVRRGAEHASGEGLAAQAAVDGQDGRLSRERLRAGIEGAASGLAHTDEPGSQGRDGVRERASERPAGANGMAGRVADAHGQRLHGERLFLQPRRQDEAFPETSRRSEAGRPGPANGFWRDADWILCRDPDGPRWRPVEPGSFPLASGIPGRVALLRGAGNAINVEVAAGFVEAVMAA